MPWASLLLVYAQYKLGEVEASRTVVSHPCHQFLVGDAGCLHVVFWLGFADLGFAVIR